MANKNAKENMTENLRESRQVDFEQMKQYRQLCREIADLEAEKEALAQGRVPSSWPVGVYAKGGGANDATGETAAKLWELSCLLAEKLNRLIELRIQIEQDIDSYSPENRRILRLYYIEGLTWENVADEVGYSQRHLSRKLKLLQAGVC
ncbi:MAG: hypothetical protein IJB67_00155 [Firmicutes bacterium]|nr:hypothetical protein [Bacillota bacterium]